MNILVTGAGSLIGHGILRSLRAIRGRKFKVFTVDPDHQAAGHWLGDHGITIPLAKDEKYLPALKEIINRFNIDILFVGTDPELIKISHAKNELKATVVISDPGVIAIGDDKWLTVNFLKENGLPYPASALSENEEEIKILTEANGFPLFAKPRIGARSAGALQINDYGSLQQILKHPNYIIQEYLPSAHGEFTAGTMTYQNKCYSQVIFRRDLKDGNTYRAYQYQNEEHERFIAKVSEAMTGVYGPLNFQYRIKNGKPVIFEINSRFSGTTPLRTAVGINEVDMALEYFTDSKIRPRKITSSNVAIFRTWSDIVIPIEQLTSFSQNNLLENPEAKYFPFMN